MIIKKVFLILFIVINLAGCALLQKRDTYVDSKFKKVKIHYENWELEKTEKELKKINNRYNDDSRIKEKVIEYKDKINKRKLAKENLMELLERLKMELNNNEFQLLENHINKDIISKIKLEELKKYNFRNIDIFYGKPEFYKKESEVIVIFNYLEESNYYDFEFKLEKGVWILKDYKERR